MNSTAKIDASKPANNASDVQEISKEAKNQMEQPEAILETVEEKAKKILKNLPEPKDNRLDVTKPIAKELELDKKDPSKGTAKTSTNPVAATTVDKPTRKEIRRLIREDVGFKAREKLKLKQPTILNKLEIPFVVILNMSLAYFLGYFNISVGYILLLIICVISIYLQRVKAFTKLLTAEIQMDATKKRIDNHFESCEWINEIIGRIWSVYEPALSSQIFDQMNLILDDMCPPFLNSLKLETLSLGSEGPKLLGAKTYPDTARDVVHMDVDVLFIPKVTNPDSFMNPLRQTSVLEYASKVVLVARIGKGKLGVDVPVAVQGISVAAKARVELRLMPGLPVVRIAELCLRENPKIDFILKPLKSLDIMDMPGLSQFLSGTIQTIVSSIMVDPNRITVNLDEIMNQARVQAQRSIGVFFFAVNAIKLRYNASDLGSKDKMYLQVQLDGNSISKIPISSFESDPNSTQQNDRVHFLLIRDVHSCLQMDLFGEGNLIQKARLLGSSFYYVKNQIPQGDDSENSSLDSSQAKASSRKKTSENVRWIENHVSNIINAENENIVGDLFLSSQFYPIENPEESEEAETTDQADDKALDTRSITSGIVRVILHQAKDIVIKNSAPRPMNTFCDILLLEERDEADSESLSTQNDDSSFIEKLMQGKDVQKIKGCKEFKSKLKKSTNSPLWESTYELFLQDIHRSWLLLRVKEEGKDMMGLEIDKEIMIGYSYFNIADWIGQEELTYREFPLKGRGDGKLILSIHMDEVKIPKAILDGEILEEQRQPIGILNCLLLEMDNASFDVQKNSYFLKVHVEQAVHSVDAPDAESVSSTKFIMERPISLIGKKSLFMEEFSCVLDIPKNLNRENENTTNSDENAEKGEQNKIESDTNLYYNGFLIFEIYEKGKSDILICTGKYSLQSGEKDIWLSLKSKDKEISRLHLDIRGGLPKNFINSKASSMRNKEVAVLTDPFASSSIIGGILCIKRKDALTSTSFIIDMPSYSSISISKKHSTAFLPVFQDSTIQLISKSKGEKETIRHINISKLASVFDCFWVPCYPLHGPRDVSSLTKSMQGMYISNLDKEMKGNLLKDSDESISKMRAIDIPVFIELLIHQAENLMGLDSGGLFKDESSRTSDPFFSLNIHAQCWYKSKVIKKTIAPVWGESSDIYFPSIRKACLILNIADWNRIESDKPLGHCIILPNVNDANSKTRDKAKNKEYTENEMLDSYELQWFNLVGQGRVQISMKVYKDISSVDTKRLQDARQKYNELFPLKYKSAEKEKRKNSSISDVMSNDAGAATVNLVSSGAIGALNVVTGTASGTANLVSGAASGTAALVGGAANGAANVVSGTANMASKPFSFAKKALFSSKNADEKDQIKSEDTMIESKVTSETLEVNSKEKEAPKEVIETVENLVDGTVESSRSESSNKLSSGISKMTAAIRKEETRIEESTDNKPSVMSRMFRRKSKVAP